MRNSTKLAILFVVTLAVAMFLLNVIPMKSGENKDSKDVSGDTQNSESTVSETVSEDSVSSSDVSVSSAVSSVMASKPSVSSVTQSVDDTSKSTVSSNPVSSAVSSKTVSKPVSSASVNTSSIAASKPSVSSTPVTKPQVSTPPVTTAKNAFETMSFTKNVFLDALIYTGYNYQKTVKDNPNWNYVLCAEKKGKGWLSNITYGGGSSGYEKTSNGLPDIKKFERGGLVCASYATYVYFNYLPNVAKVNTSMLAKPVKSYSANDWYIAGQKWVKAGYSRYIKYTAKSSGTRTIFTPAEKIPIGSLMLFTDFNNRSSYCTHICIYAGEKNGYHWVTHVGNANGPEFCAMERMSCGPDPQWPLAVISLPNNLGLK